MPLSAAFAAAATAIKTCGVHICVSVMLHHEPRAQLGRSNTGQTLVKRYQSKSSMPKSTKGSSSSSSI
jgi:hypothetical protein